RLPGAKTRPAHVHRIRPAPQREDALLRIPRGGEQFETHGFQSTSGFKMAKTDSLWRSTVRSDGPSAWLPLSRGPSTVTLP
ncbi:MAG: hypothetical protein WAT51_10030, partial [Holophaga sp.]